MKRDSLTLQKAKRWTLCIAAAMKARTALPALLGLFLLGQANPANGAWSYTWTLTLSQNINEIDVYIRAPNLIFESPGLRILDPAGWQTVFTSDTLAAATGPGPARYSIPFTVFFPSQPNTGEIIDIYYWNGNSLVGSEKQQWDSERGWWWNLGRADPVSGPAVVPEPTTVIAGALLLLPFGFQGISYLRRRVA